VSVAETMMCVVCDPREESFISLVAVAGECRVVGIL